MLATLKITVKSIFEPNVKIAEIMRFINKLKCNRLKIESPKNVENVFIAKSRNRVLKKLKFASLRLSSIIMFIVDEISAIKK